MCSAFPCGLDKNSLQRDWRVPDATKKIKKVLPTKFAFKMLNAPEGVVGKKILFKQPGLIMPAPDGHGFWAFRDAMKLSKNGKVFAIFADAYFPFFDDKGRIQSWAGCMTTVIVYDENGDGTFETAQALNMFGKDVMHIPAWVNN
jgi:hypothetical protein